MTLSDAVTISFEKINKVITYNIRLSIFLPLLITIKIIISLNTINRKMVLANISPKLTVNMTSKRVISLLSQFNLL